MLEFSKRAAARLRLVTIGDSHDVRYVVGGPATPGNVRHVLLAGQASTAAGIGGQV